VAEAGAGDEAGTTADRPCFLAVPAEGWAVEVVRTELTTWLDAVGWPREELAVVAAAAEAVGNAVRHAYPPVEVQGPQHVVRLGGPVMVAAALRRSADLRRVQVVVRDHGSWNPLSALNVESRGLRTMQDLTEEVRIRRGAPDALGDEAGTEVTLISRAVADLAA
jgi:anti-sigma regulatory factor (Ser/Thr protein kinase)